MTKLNNRGQSLIEAVLSLGVCSIIIAAIAMVVITSMNNANYAKYQNVAAHYAQEGLDIVRQQSETNWSLFALKSSGTYCLAQDSTDMGTTPVSDCATPNISSNNINFIRKIIILASGSGCSSGEKVSVIVSWSDGKCSSSNLYCHNVTLDSCFAQINNVSNP
jgi:type II secretory pathway pseudopilin PulG